MEQEKANIEEINKVIYELSDINRFVGVGDAIRFVIPFAYLILLDRDTISKPDLTIINYCRQQTSLDCYKPFKDRINKVLNQLSTLDLRTLIWLTLTDLDHAFSPYGNENSGLLISRLVYFLLDFKKDDVFYDLGSGLGLMLTTVYAESRQNGQIPVNHLYGSEINAEFAMLSKAVMEILIGSQDVFDWMINIDNGLNNKIKYTKGYVYQNGLAREMFRSRNFRSQIYPEMQFHSFYSPQWIYVDALLANLDNSKDCRAVALLFNRALSSTKDNEYVQNLLKDGWIEGVIELPPILPGTGLSPYLVVFSKGNDTVKMFNANTHDYVSDRAQRLRTKLGLEVEKILSVYKNPDNDSCREVVSEQLLKFNTLIPSRIPYSSLSEDRGERVPLNTLASIMVGSQYTTSAFTKSTENTGYKILTSSDIDDGLIGWDNLTSVEVNKTLYDKYIVHKGDLVVTTKSSKVKTAVVDIEPKDKVIVTGGMIIVRTNPELLNPTYLKMYLDSGEGIEALKSTQTGSVIISISLSEFKNIQVPKVDIRKQNRLANRYNDMLSSIGAYRDQINRMTDALKHIIDSSEDFD